MEPQDLSDEDRKIFVGGLCWETGEVQLKEYFSQFGEIESANLKLNSVTGKSRCFAFVLFKDTESVSKVLQNTHAINSKKVDVKRAKAKPGKVFFGGLHPESPSEEELKEYFSHFGNILEFEIPQDKIKNERKSFGFVTFEKEESMKKVLKVGKVSLAHCELDLRRANPKIGRMKSDYYYYPSHSYYPDYYSDYDYYSGNGGPGGGGKMKSKVQSSTATPVSPY
uniref:RRM domain-containing protein n=1 Tax=Lepeophtheirus salmonis TaxID=72036 RepID=A0A0K2SVT0_LEPSM